MPDQVSILIRLREAARAAADAKRVSGSIRGIGDASESAGRRGSQAFQALDRSTGRASLGLGRLVSGYGALQVAQGAASGVKWGLSYVASVESARERFRLFTNDVKGLTAGVSHIDLNSQFNFADLADSAAMLGNSGVKAQKIPTILQGVANAAAASGKGVEGLKAISLALSQMSSKGRLQGDELLQLTEAGAPGVQRVIQREFGLTAKQMSNIGAAGLSSNRAIDALTKNWTSGKMSQAASRQIKTLGGQWDLFTGAAQKATAGLLMPFAMDLQKNILPAANKAAAAVSLIFDDKNLTSQQKLRRAKAVIERELGPIGHDILREIDKANIPQHLGDAVGAAIPFMAGRAAKAAPHVASAFVDAWVHSGPWGQILSTLYIGRKLGLGGKIARGVGALRGAGGLAGGIAGSLKPVPVFVTNWGGGLSPKQAEEGWAKQTLKKAERLGPVAGAGIAAGATVGGFAAQTAISEALRRQAAPGQRYSGRIGTTDVPGFIPGLMSLFGSHPTRLSGGETNPFAGHLIGGLPPLTASITVKMDGRETGKSVDRVRLRTDARKG